MEISKQEKETAVEANQMLLLMMIEEMSRRNEAEQHALLQAARYKRNMDEKHVLCNDEKVLEKYYECIYDFENKPTVQEKIRYTIHRYRRRA